MTTLNTIIEEENTLDTEWEKEELVRKAERDIEFVVSNPDMYDISVQVKNIVRNLLSSRDTYWKEREAEAYESGRRAGRNDMFKMNGVQELTNEDNLK